MLSPMPLITNAIWNVLSRVVPLFLTFFLTPFLISRLGSDHYGLFMLLMSISGLMGLMSFGLGDATLRYVAFYVGRNDIAGINRVVGATLFVYLITSMFTMVLIVALAPSIVSLFAIAPSENAISILLLRLTAVSFCFSLICGAVSAIPQAMQRYDISTKIVIGMTIMQAIGMVFVLFLGKGIIGLVLLGIVVNIITLLVNIVATKRLLPTARLWPLASTSGLKEVFKFGLFSLLSHIFGISFSQSDRLLIGIFVSSGSMGFLTVPQDLALRALSIVAQGGAVLFPRFSSIDDPEYRRRLYLNATWGMLFLSTIIFVPMTIFLPDFIRLWVSPEFASKCSKVGQLIAFSSIIRGAFVPYEALFKGINKPQYITALSLFVGAISLGFNFLLIPRYGLAGAGYSYCATAILGLVTIFLTWKYILKSPSILPVVRTVLIPVMVAIVCLTIGINLRNRFPSPQWAGLIIQGIATMTVTGIMLLSVEMMMGKKNNCAKVLLRGIQNSIKRDFRAVETGP